MAEGVDTSSYPKPLPAQTPLDIVRGATDLALQPGRVTQQQQEIESRGLGIDRQKLENANQALGYMTRAMTALGPNASREQYIQAGRQAVQLGLAPASSLNVWEQKVRSARSTQDFYNEFLSTAADHQQIMNTHLGPQGYIENGQTATPIRTPAGAGGTPYATGLPIQRQQGVSETTATGQALGPQVPQLPPGTIPARGGIPGQFEAALVGPGDAGPAIQPPARLPVGALPSAAGPAPGGNFGPPGTRIISAQVMPDGTPQPRGAQMQQAPGAAQVSAASGSAVASELEHARTYAREVFPLQQAIPALERLGTKGTGPGTETINQIKSFVLSNVPGVKESDFDGTVKDFDKAKKYLTDFVNQNGSTGTNDKLAASFAGSPSVSISNAAAVDVAKSALALRNQKQAMIQAWLANPQSQARPDLFTAWAARWVDQHDPRAFGVNLLTKDAADKLFKELHAPGHEKELQNFENGLIAAQAAGLIKRPGQQ